MFFPPFLSEPPNLFPSFTVSGVSKRVLPFWNRHPRTLGVWHGEVGGQGQCAFLWRLPAEVRNEIYEYVFSYEAQRDVEENENENENIKEQEEIVEAHEDLGVSDGANLESTERQPSQTIHDHDQKQQKQVEEPCRQAHPLDLLLTCRQINMEATLIAFRLHSFVVNSPLTFHALCQRSAILPGPSLSTITSMAFVLDEKITTHSLCNWKVAEFLSNAVLLSPNINHLTIRIMTYTGEKEAFETPRRDHENFSCNTLDVRLQHLPTWLRDALDFMLQGRFYVWQSGEKWRLSFPWPQPGNMHRFAALTPRSVRGDCTVTLQQEGSGRQVNVDLIYEWDYAGLRDRERRGLVVRLEPGGKEKLDLAVVHGGTGLIWEPSKEDKIERTTTKKANGGFGEAVWWLWRGGLAQFFQAAK